MINPRLAIDVRYAAAPLSGFGRFTWNLLEGLAVLGPPEPIMILARAGQEKPGKLADHPAFIWRQVDASPFSPVGQWKLARALAGEGVKAMASPDVFAPLSNALKQVVTLHDIIPLRCPELLSRSAKGRFSGLWRQWLRLQISNADLVLTVSDHAKRDIASAFCGTDDKLRTVYNAVPTITPPLEENRRASKDKVKLLYVGRTAPYKNIVGCIDVVASLRREGLDAVLTIVGEPDPRYPEALEMVQRQSLQRAVTFTGHVDERRLQRLYREASVFLFLSRYEGFGLPPLEAMAHGVPVVSSDRASLPEVLGDAALLVDPEDKAAAVTAIRRVIEQPDLAKKLRQHGLARAAGFTQERQATMFWDAVSPLV